MRLVRRRKPKLPTPPEQTDSPPSLESSPSGTGSAPSPYRDKPWMQVAYVASKLILVLVAVWMIFHYVFALVQMDGETMYPRLRDGDLLLAYRLEDSYSQGDVVLFKIGNIQKVARVVAQEGDVIELTDDGSLMINGNVEQEEIFYITQEQLAGITYPYTVPEDSYFVLCDFRTTGSDSRSFGAVARKDIDGKVITVLRRRGI